MVDGEIIPELYNCQSAQLTARRARLVLVGLSPDHLDGRRTATDRAGLASRWQLPIDHAGGRRCRLFYRLLVFGAPAPRGDDEADGLFKEAHHRRQRVEPNRMALAELQRTLEERFLNVLEHRGDGRLQLGEGDRLLRPVKSTDDGDLPACQVARPDLDTHRHPFQLPFIELEAGPLVTPVDFDADIVERIVDPLQRGGDLRPLDVAPEA